MNRGLRNFLITTAGLLVTVGAATATTITNTNFQSWKATLTGSPTEADFSGIQFHSYNTAAGINLSAIGNSSVMFNFTGPDNGGYNLSGTSYNGFTSLAGSSDSGAGISREPAVYGRKCFHSGRGQHVRDPFDTDSLRWRIVLAVERRIWRLHLAPDYVLPVDDNGRIAADHR